MGSTPRRTFLKVAGIAGAGILTDKTDVGAAVRRPNSAQAQETPRASASTVQTPVLTIAYEDSGNPRGFPVILLHGFPDDARAYDEVVPPLTKAGYRTLVPYLRGYGATRFRDSSAPRMAEQAAIGRCMDQDRFRGATLSRVASTPVRLKPDTTSAGPPEGGHDVCRSD